MKSEKDCGKQISGEAREIMMSFPDQHKHNPNLDEKDCLDEPLKAVQVGPRQWRLTQNPIFSEAVAYGDTVEGDLDEAGDLIIERVVERSPFKTVHTMAPRMLYFSDFGKAFLDRIMELGGMWDGFAWGMFVFSYPAESHVEVEELFSAACKEAKVLGEAETRRPAELLRDQPEGGCVRDCESN